MTTFYRDDRVVVTSSAVEVDGQEYLLAELSDVHHDGWLRAVRAWAYRLGQVLTFVVLLALIPGLVVAIVIAVRMKTADGWGLFDRLLVALSLWGALAGFCWYGMAGHYEHLGEREIRARWRGQEVVLLRTERVGAFGDIYRAIRQASSHLVP